MPTIRQTPAHPTNYTKGRVVPISQVTFHHIVGSGASIQRTWENPDRNGSSTYSVGEDGVIRQHVAESDTPWTDNNLASNQRSITIEHAGGHPDVPYTESMYASAIELLRWILARHNITQFKRHKEVSNTPTACPGGLDVERIIAGAKEDALEKDERDALLTVNHIIKTLYHDVDRNQYVRKSDLLAAERRLNQKIAAIEKASGGLTADQAKTLQDLRALLPGE